MQSSPAVEEGTQDGLDASWNTRVASLVRTWVISVPCSSFQCPGGWFGASRLG